MTAAPQPQQLSIKGIVKQIVSGDTVVIRGVPKDRPPPEKTIYLSNISAPKLAKRVPETLDDPFAWEAREFLRTKLIGQPVFCLYEKNTVTNREYGTLYIGHDQEGENINELLVKEGLVSVRGDNVRSPPPELQKLIDLQEAAKEARKGKWDTSVNQEDHVRKITWVVEDMNSFLDKREGKPTKAVIEHVRDGSTVRAFLLPDFVYVTIMMNGIKSPQFKIDSDGKVDQNSKVEFADQAKFFTETRLLQRDVEIILESVNGPNFHGTILHPKGNIAEELLKAGFARCVDWTIAKMKKADVEKLRQAEKIAKEKRVRIWQDWTPPPPISDSEFTGTVVEVINGDALIVKLPNGMSKKIFLASIRPPRPTADGLQENKPPGTKSRQLYDVPWMFEAREFLRKKLIGKKVSVSVDYIQPPREGMQEKCCCTVTISNVNVAEALVSRGLATVVRYRQNDDQRASAYDSLLSAEMKAMKGLKGLHAKKDIPTHRINDYSGEPAKAKALLPHIKKPRIEALVEYVASGSRFRLFLPKDSSLITFLLSGIDLRCPRTDGVNNEEAALQFSRERCMQREVEIKVENHDRAGNFIGWLWVENTNLSVALVENGLAKIHASGENSEFAKQFINAKNTAKSNGLWKFTENEEQKETLEEEKTVDRKVNYQEVIVPVINGINFFCQFTSHEAKLKNLQQRLAQEMGNNPPLPGAYTPKKNDYCAAKFSLDDQWYRARIEKASGGKAQVQYIDYGNKAEVPFGMCAQLPAGFSPSEEKPYAHQFTLAFVQLPNDMDEQKDAEMRFYSEVDGKKLQLNVEIPSGSPQLATLVHVGTNEDVSKRLLEDGLLLVDKRKEKKFSKLMEEYKGAEEKAKSKRRGIFLYGDVTADDDKEFGMGR